MSITREEIAGSLRHWGEALAGTVGVYRWRAQLDEDAQVFIDYIDTPHCEIRVTWMRGQLVCERCTCQKVLRDRLSRGVLSLAQKLEEGAEAAGMRIVAPDNRSLLIVVNGNELVIEMIPDSMLERHEPAPPN
jgi:hypothetical protein